MLKQITHAQFLEWIAYAELEPFDEKRQDYRIAALCALIANVNRSRERRPYQIKDFLITWDGEDEPRIKKTWQEVFGVLRAVAAVQNTVVDHGVESE